ncbi:MAG: helix-turn-helix domain-containing protein, partial [Streptococcaceae bacterium]|nr:helix-turn-helix domain-containing protein [Streptococcaceae bacterium]
METIALKMSRDRRFLRHVELLKFLMTTKTHVPTSKIAQEIGCSIPTVIKEVKYLNEQLKTTHAKIKTSATGLIYFSHDKSVCFNSLILQLHRQTLAFKIMDALLKNKNWRMEVAMRELKASRTLLSTTITHMNKVLKNYHIYINSATLRFIGREENIRLALFHYYSFFGDYSLIDEYGENEASGLAELFNHYGMKPLHVSHY